MLVTCSADPCFASQLLGFPLQLLGLLIAPYLGVRYLVVSSVTCCRSGLPHFIDMSFGDTVNLSRVINRVMLHHLENVSGECNTSSWC